MSVYVVYKFFPDMKYRDEILGIYTNKDCAISWGKQFAEYSMDDPDTFEVHLLHYNYNAWRPVQKEILHLPKQTSSSLHSEINNRGLS